MTKEEKQLLLTDLCARLPYGVKVQHNNKKEVFGVVEQIEAEGDIDLSYYDEETEKWKLCCTSIDNIKPYLRSMSSMTEEEYKEFCKISGLRKKEDGNYFSNHLPEWGNSIITERVMVRTIDWLNTNHFDYRGLITMGLALEAPVDMYKTE